MALAAKAGKADRVRYKRLPWVLRTLANNTSVTEDGSHPPVKAEPSALQMCEVILTDRATSVPFTAVLNGPERTTTDNHEAASTCTVPRPRRSQQRLNWLWEQGVAAVQKTPNGLLCSSLVVPIGEHSLIC